MAKYSYIDTMGKSQIVEALSPDEALKTAPNIAPTSGVQLEVSPTKQTSLIADTLQPQKEIPTIPAPTQDLTNYQGIINANTTNTQKTETQKLLETEQAGQKTTIEKLKTLYGDIIGKTAYTAEQAEESGVYQTQKDIEELSSQLESLKIESQSIPLQAEQRYGEKTASATIATREQLRNNAIKSLDIAAQMAVKQGKLASAKLKMEQAVNLKYQPIEDEIKLKEQQLSLLDKYILTPLENERKEEIKNQLENQKTINTENKSKETAFNNYLIEASKNQAPNEVLNNARDLFNKGKETDAYRVLGSYARGSLEPTPKSTPTEEPAEKQFDDIKLEAANIFEIDRQRNEDKKINPDLYYQMRQKVPYNYRDNFDNNFGYLLSEESKKRFGIKSEEKEGTIPASIIGDIRIMKDKNAPLREIEDFVKFSGYSIDNKSIQDELSGYNIQEQKPWWKFW